MQIDIQTLKIDHSDAIEQFVRERFTAALNQHDRHVRSVSVVLKDVNGPRGGVDKECDARVELHGSDPVLIKKHDADLYAAITQAADGAKNSVGRAVDKLKEHR